MGPVETSSPPEAPEELLLAAADVLERGGWCRLEHATRDGRHCVMGALNRAASGGRTPRWIELTHPERSRVHAAAQRVGEHLGVRSLITWNDEDAAGLREVVDALLETAARPEPRYR